MGDNYKKEVIDPGDQASKLAKQICFDSHQNCQAVRIVPHNPGSFRGAVGYLWQRHILLEMLKHDHDPETGELVFWTMLEEVENDGAGGKPQFFTLVGDPEIFKGLGWEIITMTADDFARSGRLPCIIDNEVNVKMITAQNYHLFEAMIKGYGSALQQSNLVNITGEVAIMKHSITAFCDTGQDEQLILTWGASCIGLAHKDKLIDGSRIRPVQPIVGFIEPGYRCNGGTFFTDLIRQKFGPETDKILADPKAIEFARKLCVPSQSYAKFICAMIGWGLDGSICEPVSDITGIAHITGGGVWGKLTDILPEGVGALLYNMPKPAEVLLEAQEMSWETDLRLTDFQAYGTLHGGCGMLVICENNIVADNLVDNAMASGIRAQVVGETIESEDNEIIIDSKFKEGNKLSSKELEKKE